MEATFEDALGQLLEQSATGLHVAIPGTVTAYDAAKGQVDVLPGVRRPYPTEDGGIAFRPMPVIPACPVLWPGAASGWVTFPLAKGDSVLVVVADYDPAGWLASGTPQDPEDVRAHALAHGFAIPFRRRTPAAGGCLEVGGAEIHLGAGASDYVALASKVADALTLIRTWANTHTHASLKAVGTPALAALSSVAASTVKAK